MRCGVNAAKGALAWVKCGGPGGLHRTGDVVMGVREWERKERGRRAA